MSSEKFIVIGVQGNLLEAIVGIPERDGRFPTMQFFCRCIYEPIQITRPHYVCVYAILHNYIFSNDTNARKPAKTALPNQFIITQVDTVTRIWNNSNTNTVSFFPGVLSSFRHGWKTMFHRYSK